MTSVAMSCIFESQKMHKNGFITWMDLSVNFKCQEDKKSTLFCAAASGAIWS